jgi:saccharopine dehydrogenase-like NADP-dependent oxidoreductase
MLGMDSKDYIEVQGVKVAPRDILSAALPDPATLGERMEGKTCAGVLVKGLDKKNIYSEKYIYNVVDNKWSMKEYGDQAVVWQTAINPVIALELIHKKLWQPVGVCGPEWFNPRPFLDLLKEYKTSWHVRDELTNQIDPTQT